MKHYYILLTLLFAVALILTAGCTQTSPAPATPVPTQAPQTPPPTPVQTEVKPSVAMPVGMGTPGPTEMLPVNYNLEFMVQGNGDTSNPYMVVTLRGGNGLNYDSRVDVQFTKSDGTIKQDSMLPPFYIGQSVSFPCSTYQNRVEIWVTAPTVGKVKVYDQIVPFKSINP